MKNVIAIFFLLCSCAAFAQEIDPVEIEPIIIEPIEPDVIELDAVEVSAERQSQQGTEITTEDIEKTGAQDLNQAISRIPGVTVDEGSPSGDSSFSIRGFDSTYIPIIVDGISTNSPFNGRGDSSSLLIGDMESILVQKGYSSMLAGANGMGGAVHLTIAKPKDTFEAYLKGSIEADDIFSLSADSVTASIGTKQDFFYLKGTFQYRDIDHTRLPDAYKPMQGSVQPRGDRLFSDREDMKTTFIAGVTPTENLDIWATYIYQTSDKGMNPPSVSPLYSLWGWDDWEHQSLSLHGDYKDGSWDIGALLFYDTYDNTLSSYASFIHLDYGRPDKITQYDEYAVGTRLNAGYTINERHSLKGALSFRQDDHWGYRNDLTNKDDIHVREDKISVGAEYEYQPTEKLRFVTSGGFDSMLPNEYWSRAGALAAYMGDSAYKVNQDDLWLIAAQAGAFYTFTENHELRLTYARKNQFPTMNDRYSIRFGDYRPNPNLRPEVADHVELGYKGIFSGKAIIDVAVYYSHIDDKMSVIRVPDSFDPSKAVDFMTNMDAVSFYGMELSSNLFLSQYLEMGLNLSLSDYSIDSSISRDKTITYYPEITANAYLELFLLDDQISIMPMMEYRGERWVDTEGITALDPFYLFHLFLRYAVTDNFKVDISIRNLTDELYELRQNYPQSGRTYTLSASLKF